MRAKSACARVGCTCEIKPLSNRSIARLACAFGYIIARLIARTQTARTSRCVVVVSQYATLSMWLDRFATLSTLTSATLCVTRAQFYATANGRRAKENATRWQTRKISELCAIGARCILLACGCCTGNLDQSGALILALRVMPVARVCDVVITCMNFA